MFHLCKNKLKIYIMIINITSHKITHFIKKVGQAKEDPAPFRSAVCSESDCRSRIMSFITARSHTCMEIDREIFSMFILLLLIQERLLLVTRESICTKY